MSSITVSHQCTFSEAYEEKVVLHRYEIIAGEKVATVVGSDVIHGKQCSCGRKSATDITRSVV